MNWDQIEGKWTEYKGKAQQSWGKLTDDDVAEINGSREELAGKIQYRYGKTKEEAHEAVNEWLDSL